MGTSKSKLNAILKILKITYVDVYKNDINKYLCIYVASISKSSSVHVTLDDNGIDLHSKMCPICEE